MYPPTSHLLDLYQPPKLRRVYDNGVVVSFSAYTATAPPRVRRPPEARPSHPSPPRRRSSTRIGGTTTTAILGRIAPEDGGGKARDGKW